ncbi:putative vacuolar amino acid transporter YPQ1 [Ceratocystis fimbriata CBS 114723]|uniref:Putative vacuolar amino acid transporter YPQ1 n=1 Tax=Ceratocystis fimbriata CBS 114723 TaxID=1035309 RepID=A0A2C5XAR8_9PEZI|nr:putative vacuolar amino acid transporter YPQ1 [Ceratocystis fimbriata CBS 114723]
MASLVARAVAVAAGQDAGTAMSGIFGSISLTAWICLLTPQLIANYKAQSADGLSTAFLIIWLCGDITNLSGSLLTGLAPTAMALATYFCFADLILISQCVYYNRLNAQKKAALAAAAAQISEEAPLLRHRSSSIGLPGSHIQHSTHEESVIDPIRKVVAGEDETPDSKPWLHNVLGLVAVYIVGFLGWYMSSKLGAWSETPSDSTGSQTLHGFSAVAGQILGYISALCYLCARIPQILKNYHEKSCEGLALLFFLLSLTGNLTYAISLLAFSQDRDYLIKALPWFLGSAGTIIEDAIIFIQFRMYGDAPRSPLVETTET